jgi:AcrR family transcriptional regulator
MEAAMDQDFAICMQRSARRRTDPDEVRARILDVAETHFRRVGHHKTSVVDIASELGMSPANVYRFFPSRDAINEYICRRVISEVADIAFAIVRTNAPALEKIERLSTAVHCHNKTRLIKERCMHDLIVVAVRENWAVIKTHIAQMVAIFEVIIREGVEAGELKVEDSAQAARAVNSTFTPFFHPILIEQCVQHGEDTEAGLRELIRFIQKALGKSAARSD